jgi:hypothetical protein
MTAVANRAFDMDSLHLFDYRDGYPGESRVSWITESVIKNKSHGDAKGFVRRLPFRLPVFGHRPRDHGSDRLLEVAATVDRPRTIKPDHFVRSVDHGLRRGQQRSQGRAIARRR